MLQCLLVTYFYGKLQSRSLTGRSRPKRGVHSIRVRGTQGVNWLNVLMLQCLMEPYLFQLLANLESRIFPVDVALCDDGVIALSVDYIQLSWLYLLLVHRSQHTIFIKIIIIFFFFTRQFICIAMIPT
jgi:hypothetical protein